MERTKAVRSLRIAASAVCGILCVLLIVLWVRSYTYADRILRSGRLEASIHSDNGKVLVEISQNEFAKMTDWELVIGDAIVVSDEPWLTFYPDIPFLQLNLAYWIPVAVIATLAAVPWIPWRWKFSLRTLLIATTLIAVVLGLVVWSSR